ncbi:MAG: nuclear transport factor 2 family protein [Candidatus Binataceae bacterium]|nr:nuclear transport factor 2 family protein [Candidatus Binataceae bacterium]
MNDAHDRLEDRIAIAQLLDASVRLLDRAKYEEWLRLFADDGKYTIVCNDGITALGTFIVDTDRDGIAARVALLKDPDRAREAVARSHLPSWGPVNFTGPAQAQVESRFVVYETRQIDGVSRIGFVGCYEDRLVRDAQGQWRIGSRRAELDTFTFKNLVVPL